MLALAIVYQIFDFLFNHEDSLVTRAKAAVLAVARKLPFVQGQVGSRDGFLYSLPQG